MRTQALCTSLSFKRLSLAAAVVSTALTGTVAHAGPFSPFSAYAGAQIGLAPNAQNCDGQSTCDRVSGGGKAYVGWNTTPNVAAEINYFYFGEANSESDSPVAAKVRTSARAVTLNMNWSIEMFEKLNSQIRLGVARVANRKETTAVVNPLSATSPTTFSKDTEYTTSPYVGLGLSFPFNSNLRMVIGYDFISVSGGGNRSRHLLSGGFQGEF